MDIRKWVYDKLSLQDYCPVDTVSPKTIKDLKKQIVELKKPKDLTDPVEKLWNNKRPKKFFLWNARPLFHSKSGNVGVDPRIFFTYDETLPRCTGSNDDKVMKVLDWTIKNIKYTTDKSPSEFWQFAYETYERREGDCEDGAILMANMLIMSGVPYYRIRLNAGDVRGGGHCYLTYLREEDNKWYVIDWCYWSSESQKFGKPWSSANKYFGVWFSWNTKYMYGELPK